MLPVLKNPDFLAACEQARSHPGRAAVLARLADLVASLGRQSEDPSVPARVRAKAEAMLAWIGKAEARLGARLYHPAFALNVVGDALVRTDFLGAEVVGFLQIGLYFFGLDQIERKWPAQATVYSTIHADHLESFLGRASLVELVAKGRERLARGRIFCLTYHYLNGLRRAYWDHCRRSQDALDFAAQGSEAQAAMAGLADGRETPDAPAADRIGLLLRIFRQVLTAEQRWIYLAKNRHFLEGRMEEGGEVAELLREIGGLPRAADLGWAEIADALHINEKTAKREYLRALYNLLKTASEMVLGPEAGTSRYVRRVLELLRAVVQEKDLRLRSQTGRGLHVLVEKWEVALRFVMNHERISA
jgi:hypothetical protein